MQKLKKKIFRLLLLIYLILFAAVTAALGISWGRSSQNQISRALSNYLRIYTMMHSAGDSAPERPVFPEPELTGNIPEPKEDPEAEEELSIFLLSYDGSSCRLERMQNPGNHPLTTEAAAGLAEQMLATAGKSGQIGQYQFEITELNGNLLIAFADITEAEGEWIFALLLVILIGCVLCFFWILLCRRIAGVMVEPLAQAQRKQAEFIMAAGHELKTPVTVMETSLSMMEGEGISSKYLTYAREENRKMKELVTELLDLSRLQELPLTVADIEEVDLSALLESCALLFEAAAYEKGVVIDLELAPSIKVKGSKKELERLIDTLLENAIDHTAPGGRIVAGLGQDKVLSVKNQGKEIPPEEREKLFERFYRSEHTSMEGEDSHYGLGLAIAQEIAGRHGTKLQLQCSDGWVEFYMKL